jgi:transposase
MDRELKAWAGVDWGDYRHQVVLVTKDAGEQSSSFANDGTGIVALIAWLTARGGDPAEVGVAIELPRDAVVDALLEAGFVIFSLNPKQLDRFRDRYSVAGAKDDQRDGLTLAVSLRTDRGAFHQILTDDPWLVRLREATHVLEELKRELQRGTNQVRSLLVRYHREPLKLVPAADEPWFWDLLKLAPTPSSASRLRPVRVKQMLRKHRIRRFTGEAVLETVRGVPLPASAATVEACSEHLLLLLPRLRLLYQQRQSCEHRIERILDDIPLAEDPAGQKREHRDVDIFRSLPGVGNLTVATVLVESGTAFSRRDYHALRACAGTAPVTKRSGKSCRVSMRWACNTRLRQALHHWAANAIRKDPRSRLIFDRLRTRGCSYGRALRGVGDRLLKLLVVLLEHDLCYDISKRQVAA